MDLLYHITIHIALLAATPFIALRMGFDPTFRKDMMERLRGGASLSDLSGGIWVHASSVGEVRAAKILVQALRKTRPQDAVAVSTFTRTGYDLAKQEGLDPVFRLPPDVPCFLNPVFAKLNPGLLILVEAEFWPGLLRQCRRRKIPVLLANGRMSEKSFDRYRRIQSIFRWMTAGISFFSMRTQTDADRVLGLGIPRERVQVTGNIKFDAVTASVPEETGREEKDSSRLVVFGSTRPGDEGPVMDAIVRLREEIPGLRFVIAPRHVKRCSEVESLIREYGLDFELHSRTGDNHNASLILLDTLGELNSYYARADAAFVGGGFNPRFGGHNILEPAAYGLPVIFGKYMNNFEEEARLLNASGGGIQIEQPNDLYPALRDLLTRPEERARRGKAAQDTVKQNRGAVNKTLECVHRLLEKQ